MTPNFEKIDDTLEFASYGNFSTWCLCLEIVTHIHFLAQMEVLPVSMLTSRKVGVVHTETVRHSHIALSNFLAHFSTSCVELLYHLLGNSSEN